MEKPRVVQLVKYLVDLVDWTMFAQYLPGIKDRHIQIIKEENKGKINDQKRALYRKWLQIYPKATWNDVIEALEDAEREDIAEEVKQKKGGKALHRHTNKGM